MSHKASRRGHLRTSIRVCNAWVAFLDVYGFSDMVRSQNPEHLSRRLLKARAEVVRIASTSESKPVMHSLSDSIFLVYPISTRSSKWTALRRCIDDTQSILATFVKHGLPLRGGVAFGKVSYGPNLLLGRAVLAAVNYEDIVPAPLVLLPAREISGKAGHIEFPVSDIHNIILKDGGTMSAKLLFPSPIDGFYELVLLRAEQLALNGPYLVATAWNNARDFLYHYRLTSTSREAKP